MLLIGCSTLRHAPPHRKLGRLSENFPARFMSKGYEGKPSLMRVGPWSEMA